MGWLIYALHMPYNDLTRGWRKVFVMRELAKGERTQGDIAREFGVSSAAVTQFAQAHGPEIDEIRASLASEWAGLWVADKNKRLAEYQSDIDKITQDLIDTPDDKLLALKVKILRQVAEETGQLKNQVEVGGTITYVVRGVDPDDLQ